MLGAERGIPFLVQPFPMATRTLPRGGPVSTAAIIELQRHTQLQFLLMPLDFLHHLFDDLARLLILSFAALLHRLQAFQQFRIQKELIDFLQIVPTPLRTLFLTPTILLLLLPRQLLLTTLQLLLYLLCHIKQALQVIQLEVLEGSVYLLKLLHLQILPKTAQLCHHVILHLLVEGEFGDVVPEALCGIPHGLRPLLPPIQQCRVIHLLQLSFAE